MPSAAAAAQPPVLELHENATFTTPEIRWLDATPSPTNEPWAPLPAAIKPAPATPLGLSVWQRKGREALAATEAASDDGIVRAVTAAAERLLVHMGEVTDAGIAVLSRCSSVKQLELRWAVAGTVPPSRVSGEAIVALANCPLATLHFDCCVAIDLTEAIVAIAERTRTLRHLTVHECNVDAEAAMEALSHCVTLRTLEWHTHATDVAVWELAHGGGSGTSPLECVRLHTYQPSGATDDALLAIASACANLVTLDAAGLARGGARESGVLALAGQIDGVRGCPRLRHLEVGSTHASPLTERVVAALCDGALPQLEYLGLAGCSHVSAAAVERLAARRPALVIGVGSERGVERGSREGEARPCSPAAEDRTRLLWALSADAPSAKRLKGAPAGKGRGAGFLEGKGGLFESDGRDESYDSEGQVPACAA
ncbi:hypothetical protein AB1Y20_018397 [Prymnesium parvum]